MDWSKFSNLFKTKHTREREEFERSMATSHIPGRIIYTIPQNHIYDHERYFTETGEEISIHDIRFQDRVLNARQTRDGDYVLSDAPFEYETEEEYHVETNEDTIPEEIEDEEIETPEQAALREWNDGLEIIDDNYGSTIPDMFRTLRRYIAELEDKNTKLETQIENLNERLDTMDYYNDKSAS